MYLPLYAPLSLDPRKKTGCTDVGHVLVPNSCVSDDVRIWTDQIGNEGFMLEGLYLSSLALLHAAVADCVIVSVSVINIKVAKGLSIISFICIM